MKKILIEVAGWYGVGAILLAYTLVSFKIAPADGLLYQLLNLTGASGIAVISIMKKAKQPATLNIVWAVVAFIALLNIALRG